MIQLIADIAEAMHALDRSGIPFKSFKPGVGPYGEPQRLKYIAQYLGEAHPARYAGIKTCRVPDVLIPDRSALEFKIVRPYGDNDIEAEHWSQNLLHPYKGNVSAVGDAFKLIEREGVENRGLVVIAYEHDPPRINLQTLISAFELIARQLLDLPLGTRHTHVLPNCIHPVHQRALIFGWRIE